MVLTTYLTLSLVFLTQCLVATNWQLLKSLLYWLHNSQDTEFSRLRDQLFKTDKTIPWARLSRPWSPPSVISGTRCNLSWRLPGTPLWSELHFQHNMGQFISSSCNMFSFVLSTPSITTGPSLSPPKRNDNKIVVFNKLKEGNYKAENRSLILDHNYYYL